MFMNYNVTKGEIFFIQTCTDVLMSHYDIVLEIGNTFNLLKVQFLIVQLFSEIPYN